MLMRVIRDDTQGMLYQAMDAQNYARYWHGYLVVLRPLLKVFSYPEIRSLNYFVIFLFAFACACRMKERIGGLAAAGFVLSLLAGYIVVVPQSMQYMSVFVILFIALLLLHGKIEDIDSSWGSSHFL